MNEVKRISMPISDSPRKFVSVNFPPDNLPQITTIDDARRLVESISHIKHLANGHIRVYYNDGTMDPIPPKER
ncbi:MAG: hypothetical protein JWN14_2962 [Chthonomonadales bacterium]|nr:hypothetical protein [Chthonomonadales bacterium]